MVSGLNGAIIADVAIVVIMSHHSSSSELDFDACYLRLHLAMLALEVHD